MQNNYEEMRELYEEIGSFRKTFSKKECLHPEAPHNCKGGIVKAHTIQKSGGLTEIAQDGHVFRPDPYCDPTEITRIGINKASTFTGFCEFHDDTLFAPIEKSPLQLTRRHAFLLAFRVVSHELFLKRRAVELQIPDGAPFPDFMLGYQAGARIAIRNLQEVHSEMGNAILRRRFRKTNFFALEFDTVPQVLCTGAPNVEFDFHGNRLQFLTRREPLEYITFSILPFGRSRGVVVFAWHGKSNVNARFIRSLSSLSKRDIPDAIVRFAFQSIENMFLAPNWWDELSEAIKERLLKRYDSSFWKTESQFIDLRPDGIGLAGWNVVDKATSNLKL